jgi:hypothetical protein
MSSNKRLCCFKASKCGDATWVQGVSWNKVPKTARGVVATTPAQRRKAHAEAQARYIAKKKATKQT